MNEAERHFYEFDDFRLDVEERLLTRAGQIITLNQRDLDILLVLVKSAGETVGKSDLMETVWENTFVEEGNLNRHVSTLRKALGDDKRKQQYIKTIPKTGYRFTGRVRRTVETSEHLVEYYSRDRMLVTEVTIERFWTMPRLLIAAAVAVATLFGTSAFYISSRARATTPNTEAMDLYQQGRALWQTRGVEDLHEATLLLGRAAAMENAPAIVHSALADAYAFDYGNWKKAEAEARKAIELDPTLGEPHASIGFIRLFWEWDLESAGAELEQSVRLSPDYSTGHQWFAIQLAATGHYHAARMEIEKALTLEPASFAIRRDRCQILYFNERYEEALAACRDVLNARPDSAETRELIYEILMSKGETDAAVRTFVDNLSRSEKDNVRAAAERFRRTYDEGGVTAFRRAQIDHYAKAEPSIYRAARVYAENGDWTATLETLRKAVEHREFDALFAAADPAFHTFRYQPDIMVSFSQLLASTSKSQQN